MQAIVPIGALFAGTLWLSNAAYLYLSVSFIQMLKALMPVAVFGIGCGFGIESFGFPTLINMLIVTLGVAIASYGELNFHVLGVLLQLTAVLTESSRLTLVQILLQRKVSCTSAGSCTCIAERSSTGCMLTGSMHLAW